MRKFWLAGAVLWAIFIGVACLVRFDDLPSVEIGISPNDKIVHGFLYFSLTFLLAKSLSRKALLGAFCISTAYGITIEVMQGMFTNFRTADPADVAANIAGSVIAIALFKLTQKKPD